MLTLHVPLQPQRTYRMHDRSVQLAGGLGHEGHVMASPSSRTLIRCWMRSRLTSSISRKTACVCMCMCTHRRGQGGGKGRAGGGRGTG